MTDKPLFNIIPEHRGDWIFHVTDKLFSVLFPRVQVIHDKTKSPDLVIKSHFYDPVASYTCPYITWSGESYPVPENQNNAPLLEINTFYSMSPNSIYFPHLVSEIQETKRPTPTQKKYCAAYAASVTVKARDEMFLALRSREKTCFAFGACQRTPDNPFEAPREKRQSNHLFFTDFAFCVSMENTVKPGYLTEKIGNAFLAGTIPIYNGDPHINRFFNPDSFVNVSSFPSVDKCAEHVINIWRDPQKLQKYLNEPITFPDSCLFEYEAVYKLKRRPWMTLFENRLKEEFPDL